MTRSLKPGILSRPAPWLTAAILLLIAAVAVLFAGGRPASAFPASDDPDPRTPGAAEADRKAGDPLG